MNYIPSRRDLLKAGGALVVSFQFAKVDGSLAQDGAAATAKPVALTEVDSFLAIDTKGLVTIYSGKVDLGTGVRTALMQMVAEELDVPFASVTLVEGDTALTPEQGPTWGSLSIQVGGVQLRQAAATAKDALLKEAATRLYANKPDLTVIDGIVHAKSGEKVAYAELIGGKGFALRVDSNAPVKNPKDYKIVGQSIARVDIPGKVTGAFTYMQDFRVPGMLHGRVVRPPSVGSELESVDEGSIGNIAGIVKVVREGNFLAVVAENEWAAIKGARDLKATWSKWEGLPEQAKLYEHVRATKIAKDEVTSNVGDVAAAGVVQGAKKLNATYNFTIHTHGSIGPSCAVAEFKDGKLTSWSASQATHNLRKQLAQMFGMAPADVRCIYLEGSGCYGRNGHEDAAGDAALLAKAVGRPVRVQWSRGDEHGWDPKGPPTLIDLRAVLDTSGNVTSWESEFFIPQSAGGFHVPLTPATLAGLPQDPHLAPGNIINNSAIPYKFPNIKTVCHRLETTPFRPSWIRTPGRMQNTFANEAFMDELAAAAGADPLEFRLKYLGDDARGIEALRRVATLAKWQKRDKTAFATASASGVATGRGLSYVKYELNRTYVACVADVEVDRATGMIRVPRFYVAHDCGQIINPDGLKNQLDGSVIQTMSRTLMEELTFDRSHVTSLDWESYRILKFPEMPDIAYDLIDRPNEKPWGVGEPAAAVIPAAISSAVYDAIGVRLRSVPFTPAKVKEAMKSI